MTGQSATIFGICRDTPHLERTIDALSLAGFGRRDISVRYAKGKHTSELATHVSARVDEDTGMGRHGNPFRGNLGILCQHLCKLRSSNGSTGHCWTCRGFSGRGRGRRDYWWTRRKAPRLPRPRSRAPWVPITMMASSLELFFSQFKQVVQNQLGRPERP